MVLKDGRRVSQAGAVAAAAVLRYPDPDLVETDVITTKGSGPGTASTTSSWEETYNTDAAAEVQSLVDAVDHFLYGDGDHSCLDGASDLLAECHFWKTQFAHLRVLGKQIILPQTVASSRLSDDGSEAHSSRGKKYDMAEEEDMVDKVVERLCQLFWPEVDQWTKLSRERLTNKPVGRVRTNFATPLLKHRTHMPFNKLSGTTSCSRTSPSSDSNTIRVDGLPLSVVPRPRTKENVTGSP